MGSFPLKNGRPSHSTLWEGIDTLNVNVKVAGKVFDVSVLTVAPHKPPGTHRAWPKMLVMHTQSGKFSLSVPFDKILSIGRVGNNVIVVCWTRANVQKRTKSYCMHAVEFSSEEAANNMSEDFILECEKTFQGKGVQKVLPIASAGAAVGRDSGGSGVTRSRDAAKAGGAKRASKGKGKRTGTGKKPKAANTTATQITPPVEV